MLHARLKNTQKHILAKLLLHADSNDTVSALAAESEGCLLKAKFHYGDLVCNYFSAQNLVSEQVAVLEFGRK